MPRRPLSAYNLFFRDQRLALIQEQEQQEHKDDKDNEDTKLPPQEDTKLPPSTQSNDKDKSTTSQQQQQHPAKVGFAEMAKTISLRWKEIDPSMLAKYQEMARLEQIRYNAEMDAYRRKEQLKEQQQQQQELS